MYSFIGDLLISYFLAYILVEFPFIAFESYMTKLLTDKLDKIKDLKEKKDKENAASFEQNAGNSLQES